MWQGFEPYKPVWYEPGRPIEGNPNASDKQADMRTKMVSSREADMCINIGPAEKQTCVLL